MNLTATNYDRTNARECALASAAAYGLGPFNSADHPLPAVIQDHATDTQLIVIEYADHIVIAFRGTTNLRDWITDAKFFRRLLVEEANGDRCEVHAGFLQAYESVIETLAQHLTSIVVGERKVFVTGHSLGGALAILAALELKRQKFNIAQVYTFGQPRVGNAAFKRLYEWSLGSSTFRVVYQEDIVARIPHLPACTDFYRHVGTEIFLSNLSSEEIVAPSLFRLLASDASGLYRAWLASGVPGVMSDALNDHRIANYLSYLNS